MFLQNHMRFSHEMIDDSVCEHSSISPTIQRGTQKWVRPHNCVTCDTPQTICTVNTHSVSGLPPVHSTFNYKTNYYSRI